MNEVSVTCNPATSPDTPNVIFFAASLGGPSPSSAPGGQQIDLFGAVPAPASPFPAPAKAKAKRTTDTSGQSSPASSASVALQSCLESRLVPRLGMAGSMEYSQTWKQRVTPAGRLYMEHTARARRTSDSDFTGAPATTPWPTPAARDWRDGRSNQHGLNARPLNEVATLAPWPTPTSLSFADSHQVAGCSPWATPRAEDAESSGMRHSRGVADTLSAQSGQDLASSTAATARRGVLDPAHSRWLQGFPASWDRCAPGWQNWELMQGLLQRIKSAD